jgi:hypothetical protein
MSEFHRIVKGPSKDPFIKAFHFARKVSKSSAEAISIT